MKVDLTKLDIENGERFNSSGCPLVLAILNIPNVKSATVVCTGCYIKFENKKIFSVYRLPWRARQFIKYFDNPDRFRILYWIFVRPFNFKIKEVGMKEIGAI